MLANVHVHGTCIGRATQEQLKHAHCPWAYSCISVEHLTAVTTLCCISLEEP